METETILIKRSDGGCSIMTFVIQSPHDTRRNEPSDTNINAAIAKGRLDCVSWRRINPGDLPGREYRNAWTDTGNAIGHNMAKAREIHRSRLRSRRAPMLEQLDVEYQRADEAGDAQQKRAIAAEKQRLRDATADPRIESAETIEQLSGVDALDRPNPEQRT